MGSIDLSHEGGVSTITINNPPLNVFSTGMLGQFIERLNEVDARDATRAVVIVGNGARAFSAGADLSEEQRFTPQDGRQMRETGRAIVEKIETLSKPVVTAVRGWCIGGGTGISWIGDIRIACETARFRAGDAYLGIVPTWSLGMVRLVHFLGRNRTLDLLLLGEDIDAQTALQLGLVSRVVPRERFDEEVHKVAQRLAGAAPMSVRAIKEAVRAQYRDGPDRAALLEEMWCQRVFASQDSHEGIQAFKEKRKPVFTGR